MKYDGCSSESPSANPSKEENLHPGTKAAGANYWITGPGCSTNGPESHFGKSDNCFFRVPLTQKINTRELRPRRGRVSPRAQQEDQTGARLLATCIRSTDPEQIGDSAIEC